MADANLEDLLAALREVSEASDSESVGDEDDDQESVFRRRKPLGTVMLLERLEQQAEFKDDQDRALAARPRRLKGAPSRLEQKTDKLMEMRQKANAVEQELKLNRKLKLETERLQKDRVKLHKENLTTRDRMELEANTATMANWASHYCKEAGTNWREEVRAAFGSQYQPPVDDRNSKNS
jgi:sirohydrochlorin ferrochelatase